MSSFLCSLRSYFLVSIKEAVLLSAGLSFFGSRDQNSLLSTKLRLIGAQYKSDHRTSARLRVLNMTTTTPRITPPSHHRYAPVCPSIPNSNYGLEFKEFSEALEFLKTLKGDPDLQSRVIALFQSEWKPTIAAALNHFNERLRCSKCSCNPSDAGSHRRLSAAGQRRLDDLIDEMKMINVEKLDKAKFWQWRRRLRELELEYLDANFGATCKGLALNETSRG
jgi:hypothetical protein